ncbi:MAG: 50S ribosomal protein L23 [Candidatus Magnetoglobus multicellularis str. Araruama]|uniref:Large ribosomal subunit protein uL23 n=1 Tax=Candidatus Magnetoglobus multicellularis str. Araruama TaxID=890399 RepID=A0A1V1PHU3_9BACT|nr:MAG: 50S ribosomal protein L23 [Candidatus Magnetoglobus multicellularis str. Araruama]
MDNHQIIIRPIVTEKTHIMRDTMNQIVFEVHRDANRIQISKAVEEMFKVRVIVVNTLQVKGKRKRRGRIMGKRRDWKKAIVTLAAGDKVEFFEGV